MPSPSKSDYGHDHLEGCVDVKNWPSRKILDKCGFTICETMPTPEGGPKGASQVAVYRKARPGKTLEEMGLIKPKEANIDEIGQLPPIE